MTESASIAPIRALDRKAPSILIVVVALVSAIRVCGTVGLRTRASAGHDEEVGVPYRGFEDDRA